METPAEGETFPSISSVPYPFRIAAKAASFNTFERASWIPRTGGIAQLAERQLCKLDVAGSNPAASTTTGAGGRFRKSGRVAQLVRARP